MYVCKRDNMKAFSSLPFFVRRRHTYTHSLYTKSDKISICNTKKTPCFVKVFFEKQAKITKNRNLFHACILKKRIFSKDQSFFVKSFYAS